MGSSRPGFPCPTVEDVRRGHASMPVTDCSILGMEGQAPLTGDADPTVLLVGADPCEGELGCMVLGLVVFVG